MAVASSSTRRLPSRLGLLLSGLVFLTIIYCRQGSRRLVNFQNGRFAVEEENEIKSIAPRHHISTKRTQHHISMTRAQPQRLVDPKTTNNATLPEVLIGKTRMFLLARSDRSGAAILDYLKGLSMALEYGLEFGGICGDFDITALHQDMVKALGLDTLIKFRSCPTNRTTDAILEKQHNRGIKGSFSPGVLEYIRSASHERRKPAPPSNTKQVGVHIRRGDVNPCGYWLRYFPNSFYKLMIERYAPPGSNVTIFSEPESHESWNDFSNHNLALGGNITDTWSQMLEMDVFIMSRSTFSIVPAIVSKRMRTSVYLPYLRNDPIPLSHWTVVDQDTLNHGAKQTSEIKKNCTKNPNNMHPAARFATFKWPENS